MNHLDSTRRFHFIREIASGGFGSVYLAKVIHADGFTRLAAIKLLHPKWSEDEEITKRMRDEARLLGRLRHKHIVDVMDLTIIDGRCAVLMEYLEAVDIKVIINHCVEQGASIPLRVALEACAAVASALDAAYNRPPFPGEKPLRVIHRDIKPSNIMIDDSGTVKVLDFGVARAEFDQREAKTEEMSFGSLEYMPPERLFFEPESAASDIYSLGTTLFEMLALEKFGKAKLRQGEQEQFVEQRFDDLLLKHPLPGEEIEDILHDLLWDMLAFDENDRPSAGDCVSRMRSFSRRLQQEESLEEWSERVIPPLVRRMQREERAASDLALVNRVLTEDTAGFQNRISDEPTVAPTDLDGPFLGNALPPLREDEQPTVARRIPPKPKTLPPPPGRSAGPLRADIFDDGLEESGMTVPLSSAPYIREPVASELPAFPSVAPMQRQVLPGMEDLDDEELGEPTVQYANLAKSAGERDSTVIGPGAVDSADLAAPDPPTVARSGPPSIHGSQPGFALPPRPPPSPPQRPGYTSLPPESAASAPQRKRRLWVVALATFLVASLIGGSIVVMGVLGAVAVVNIAPDRVTGFDTEPAEAPVPAPAPAPAPEVVELAEGEGVRFESLLPNTRRMVVQCESGNSTGGQVVSIAGETPGRCTVTAVNEDRQRATAVLDEVEPRTYRCFEGGDATCE